VNSIEDRLRDAYRDAAENVRPDTIRQLGGLSVTISRRPFRRSRRITSRVIIPLTAATAVVVVAIAMAVIIPQLLPALRSTLDPRTGVAPARLGVSSWRSQEYRGNSQTAPLSSFRSQSNHGR